MITAGGRFAAELAQLAGTSVKALLSLQGRSLLTRVLDAVRGAVGDQPVVVVGPEAVAHIAQAAGAQWVAEGPDGIANLRRGLEALATPQVLCCASDLPFLQAATLASFLVACAQQPGAAIYYPVVWAADFHQAFPGSPALFVPLADGLVTGGSVLLVERRTVLAAEPLARQVFNARKSQLGMAWLLGLGFVLKFLLRRLWVREVEARASQILGVPCAALLGSDPALAYDIDRREDLEDLWRRVP
ncbi:MAG: nucleotidyltransferase family protein [Deinococcus sp.]|nr:nucleotidyltransferase family protein [Deinococcus sp.]